MSASMYAEDFSSGLEEVCVMIVNMTKVIVILLLIRVQRVEGTFC